MIILIDSNHLCYFHSFRGPLTYNNRPVGIIFGFMQSLLSLAKKFETSRFVFAWDSHRSLRKVWYPAYKENRRTPEEEKVMEKEVFPQFMELRTKVLPQFGFRNVFMRTGYEADDIIASICKYNKDEEIAIVSTDNDLYQCLSPLHFMYGINKKVIYDRVNFVKEWGIEPEQWAEVKSIAGCPGDNVPGIDGIGNKMAIKYLKDELSPKTKTFQKIEEGKLKGVVTDTKIQVELPFPGLGRFCVEDTEIFEAKDFLSICDEYGFRSFIAQESIWQDYFNMKGRR